MPETAAGVFPGTAPAVRPKRRPRPSLVTRLEQLGKILRPTPHVPLAVEHMNQFAKHEYVSPVGSIKDRPAYWILKADAVRRAVCYETTVIAPASGNVAAAPGSFNRLAVIR